jgi:triosephosphate isomerase
LEKRRILVAYEPVWAIGTGNTAEPRDAQEMAAHIRFLLAEIDAESATRTPILYGGSVTPDNASLYIDQEDVDGALVGGASVNLDSFLPIVGAALENRG